MRYLYAAYGSNLNHGQMAARCPKAKFAGVGLLRDHRLVFRGVADIEPARGESVPVGLWSITDECLEALDSYEGYPSLYGRKGLKIVKPNRKVVTAIIYFMHRDGYASPTISYYGSIHDGYQDCNLPTERLTRALHFTRELVMAYEDDLQNTIDCVSYNL